MSDRRRFIVVSAKGGTVRQVVAKLLGREDPTNPARTGGDRAEQQPAGVIPFRRAGRGVIGQSVKVVRP